MKNKISWEVHVKSYFLEEALNEYVLPRNVSLRTKEPKSCLAALKIWYRFPDQEMKDTGNYIVLYRHDHEQFHPRINMQLKGKRVGKTNTWLDAGTYQMPAPFDNKKKFRLSTLTRFSYYDKHKEWFFRFGVPHLLAVMVEKDFDYQITGVRRGSGVFIF